MSGIEDLNKILTNDEKGPYLYKWFDPGFEDEQKKLLTLMKKRVKRNKILSKSLAIWPLPVTEEVKTVVLRKSGGVIWFQN